MSTVQVVAWVVVALMLVLGLVTLVLHREAPIRGRERLRRHDPPSPFTPSPLTKPAAEMEAKQPAAPAPGADTEPAPEPNPSPEPAPIAAEVIAEPKPDAGVEAEREAESRPTAAEVSEAALADAAVVRPLEIGLREPAPMGREILRTELLHGLRTSARRTISLHSMDGIGGVGATTLARSIAAEAPRGASDVALMIDLRGSARDGERPVSPREAMTRLIGWFAPETEAPESDAKLAQLYTETLGRARGILVLDDAPDAAAVEALLPPDGWRCVVTCARAFTLTGVCGRRVDGLRAAEGAALARSIAPRRADLTDDAAARLSTACSGVPLAIGIAASALAQDAGLAVGGVVGAIERGASDPVLAAVEVSLGGLGEEDRQRFAELAMFHGGFDASSVAAVWDVKGANAPERARRMLAGLASRGVIEWDAATGRGRLHDAVRTIASRRLGEPEKLLTLRFAIHLTRVWEQAAREESDGLSRQAWARLEIERANLAVHRSLLADPRYGGPEMDLLARRMDRLGSSRGGAPSVGPVERALATTGWRGGAIAGR